MPDPILMHLVEFGPLVGQLNIPAMLVAVFEVAEDHVGVTEADSLTIRTTSLIHLTLVPGLVVKLLLPALESTSVSDFDVVSGSLGE